MYGDSYRRKPSRSSTAHPKGPWRSNHMHHLRRRSIFLHQLGRLVMRCWNLTGNYAFFPPTISGQSRNRQRQAGRCNCTTKNDATEDEWIHCPRVGWICPYISSSLDNQSDTAIPESPEIAASKIYGFQSSPNHVIEKPKMCQRTLKMPRHIERHGCRNLMFWRLSAF